MKPLTIAIAVDFWGPEIRNGTYRITNCAPDSEGFRLYGYRVHKLAWLENCIVRPSVNSEGFTVRYYEDGQTHYLWAPYDPRED